MAVSNFKAEEIRVEKRKIMLKTLFTAFKNYSQTF